MDGDHGSLDEVTTDSGRRSRPLQIPALSEEIESLYVAEKKKLMHFLVTAGGLKPPAAEDVLHDAFAALQARMADQARPSLQRPKLYLWRIADNASKRRKVRDGQRPDREQRAQGLVSKRARDQTCEIDDRLELEKLSPALAALPAQQRIAFMLRNFYGFERSEAAEVMEISPRTLDTHIERANAKLAAAQERSERQ